MINRKENTPKSTLSGPFISNNGNNFTKFCTRCCESIAKSLKCVDCDGFYHSSCAKRQYVKILGDSLLECYNRISEELDKLSDTEKKIEIAIFQYIIKQKDKLILN